MRQGLVRGAAAAGAQGAQLPGLDGEGAVAGDTAHLEKAVVDAVPGQDGVSGSLHARERAGAEEYHSSVVPVAGCSGTRGRGATGWCYGHGEAVMWMRRPLCNGWRGRARRRWIW